MYDRPSYFSGTRSSHTSAPISSPISPTALENPPAPQSVIALYSPRSRACEHHVEHHLFGDRVADLHRAAGERFAFAGQLGGAERGAVNAVAAGAAADGHD